MSKLFGDVSKEDKALAAALEVEELNIDKRFDMPAKTQAKCYVALAHDWYVLGVEDQGLKLLAKAEKVYPGYFKNQITLDCYASPDFEYLVRGIMAQLVSIMISKPQDTL